MGKDYVESVGLGKKLRRSRPRIKRAYSELHEPDCELLVDFSDHEGQLCFHLSLQEGMHSKITLEL